VDRPGEGANVSVVDELGQVEVLDPGGERVRLESLWRQRPVVLVFVRHYG
jgi:hypothetical protein